MTNRATTRAPRMARCSYYGHDAKYEQPCQSETLSDRGLPFFEARPEADHDRYYCGCWGWD